MNLSHIVAEIELGMIPAPIYSDPEIFALEEERVFGRSWMFLAHESEIPDPGDYVVRRVVNDSFIVVRDEDGNVRVLFNMCLHRGMQLCRAERGNASHFRCPYHAWTYKNSGAFDRVPFMLTPYGGEENLARAGTSLLSPPHVASYRGLVFASLDPNAPALEAAIGDFALLPRPVLEPEPIRPRAAWPAAMDHRCQLEDRRRELLRRHLPHAAYACERR